MKNESITSSKPKVSLLQPPIMAKVSSKKPDLFHLFCFFLLPTSLASILPNPTLTTLGRVPILSHLDPLLELQTDLFGFSLTPCTSFSKTKKTTQRELLKSEPHPAVPLGDTGPVWFSQRHLLHPSPSPHPQPAFHSGLSPGLPRALTQSISFPVSRTPLSPAPTSVLPSELLIILQISSQIALMVP